MIANLNMTSYNFTNCDFTENSHRLLKVNTVDDIYILQLLNL